MNLSEYQKRFGIKRIDFSNVRETDMEEEYGDDILICPYCHEKIEYESEDTDTIIRGTKWQCPNCEKWFYADAEMTVNTTCVPIEDAVLDHRRDIEASYEQIDLCEEKGMDFPDQRYGFIEWMAYEDWAMPLFENMEKEINT